MNELHFDGSPNHTPVGYFTYTVPDDHWSWSDGLYELHGYAPQSVPATTELVLRHKHPDDVARAFDVLETAIEDALPFSCYHRIIDAKDEVRYVLSVGRGHLGADGRVEQVTGFLVDLTEAGPGSQREAEEAQVRVAKARSAVEQAKGVVMVALGCDDEQAFAMLCRYADDKGVRLHELAQRLVQEVSARPLPDSDECRTRALKLLDQLQP